jgi:hypothetical protein
MKLRVQHSARPCYRHKKHKSQMLQILSLRIRPLKMLTFRRAMIRSHKINKSLILQEVTY